MAEKARDIYRRIKGIQSTKKITNAMRLIAASRIAKAQARTERARPYAKALEDMIQMLASESRGEGLLSEREEIRNVDLIVLTGDRGLAGAYNSNVLREASRAQEREEGLGHATTVTSVGRKGAQYFRFRKVPLADTFTGMSDQPTYADAVKVAAPIIERFTEQDSDKVLVAYTDFLSPALQRAVVAQVLPAAQLTEGDESAEVKASFEYEPDPEELLDALLPRYVEMKIYQALLESSTSEHAARMRAMKSATDKAEELIRAFQLRANRARQSEITSELADIVGATEALK